MELLPPCVCPRLKNLAGLAAVVQQGARRQRQSPSAASPVFCPRVKHPTVNGLLQLLAADIHAQIVVQATVRPRSVINVTHGLEPQSCAAVTCTAGCRWQPCDFAPYWLCSALNIKLRPKPPRRHKTLHRYGCSRQAAASAVKLQSYIQPNPKPPTLMSQPSPLSEKSHSVQGFPVHPYTIIPMTL